MEIIIVPSPVIKTEPGRDEEIELWIYIADETLIGPCTTTIYNKLRMIPYTVYYMHCTPYFCGDGELLHIYKLDIVIVYLGDECCCLTLAYGSVLAATRAYFYTSQ
jgi:hypothetical protein